MRSLSILVFAMALYGCNILPSSFSKLTEENDTPANAVPMDPCSGAVEEAKLPVNFAAHSANCSFDDGSNDTPAAGFWQARHQQKVTVGLPPHSKLCNAKLTSVTQKTMFADALVLLWDKYVLFSTEKLATESRLDSESGTGLVWNWEKMRGAALKSNDTPYCIEAGDKACSLPKVSQYDSVSIDLNPASLKSILAKQETLTSTSFTLVTAGDGAEWEALQDSSLTDCYHRKLDFELTVSYVPSPSAAKAPPEPVFTPADPNQPAETGAPTPTKSSGL